MPYIGKATSSDLRFKSGVVIGKPSWLRSNLPSLAQQIAEILAGKTAVWYDPNDLSTLFQDFAGNTPVVVGMPVGLMLDKSTGGLLSSPIPIYSESFASGTGGFGQYQATLTNDAGSLKVTGTVSGGGSNTFKNISSLVTSNGLYRLTFKVKVNPATITALNSTTQITTSPYTSTGIYTISGLNENWTTATRLFNVFDYTKGAQLTFNSTGTITGFPVFWIDDIVVTKVSNSANNAIQTSSANRPILRQDSGGKYYLETNGTNQSMRTASIPWSGTDQIATAAYMKTVSGNSNVYETSTNSSSLTTASSLQDSQYSLQTRQFSDSLAAFSGGTESLGSLRLVTGYRSSNTLAIRLNGIAGGSATNTNTATPQPLFLMARNSASSWFGGRFYGLIILNTTYLEVNRVLIEKQLAAQSGVTLP